MIVETFGPPGAGKTTFSQALALRLRDRGYTVDVVLTLPNFRSEFLRRGGLVPAIVRVTNAICLTVALLFRLRSNVQGFRLAQDLLRLMPPKSPVWWIRLSQYILRLCCEWKSSHRPDHIVLFDQGFVQAVCTLALFSEADQKTIEQAIRMRSGSDVLIRFDAPADVLEQRLYQRLNERRFAERWFEPDVDVFLKAKPIADYVGRLLTAENQRMICVNSLDRTALLKALDEAEQEISARFGRSQEMGLQGDPGSEQPARRAAALAPAAAGCEDNRNSVPQGIDAVLTQRLASASLWSFLIYVGGAGVTCLAQLAIARAIGADSYGIYAYVLALTTLLSYVGTLGFNTVLLRFVPAYSTTGRWSLARGVIGFAFQRSSLITMAIAVFGIPIVLSLAGHPRDETTISLAIGLATVPLVSLYVLGSATVRALGGVISAIAPERLVRDGLLLVLVLLAGTFEARPINAVTVLVALMATSAVTLTILAVSLRKLWPQQLNSATPAYAPHDWWALAIPVMIMIGIEVLMSRAGLILLGWSGDHHAAGIFALGLNLALFLVLPRIAVGTFFSPNVSRLHAHKNQAALQSLFARATVLSLAGTAVLALPLLVLIKPVLAFFGEEFLATAPIAQILIAGQIFAAATGPQQNLLTMTGHERAAAIIMVAGAALNILACAIGIAFFGAIGAAIATAGTNIISNAVMAIYIYRQVKVRAGLLFAIVEFRRSIAATGS
jgi:O-antigen/teichoic acid export membrane protein